MFPHFNIMGWYGRAKFALRLASKIVSNKPITQPISRINHYRSWTTKSTVSGFPFRVSPISMKLGFEYGGRLLQKNRCYTPGRKQVTKSFKWFQNTRKYVTVGFGVGGVIIVIYLECSECAPYTKRVPFVLLPRSIEKMIGDAQLFWVREVVGTEHPDSVRLRLILKNIIQVASLNKDIMEEASPNKKRWWDRLEWKEDDTSAGGHNDMHPKLIRQKDYILAGGYNDKRPKWIQQLGSTGDLEGFNCEVLLVNEPTAKIYSLLGGKIVVSTGLIELYNSDPEIATLIAHEVGHVLARHSAEGITTYICCAIYLLNIYLLPILFLVYFQLGAVFLGLPPWKPSRNSVEMEADYIGLILMASAGYDPRIALTVHHEKSGERAQFLAQEHIMEEAISIYNEVIAEKDSDLNLQ